MPDGPSAAEPVTPPVPYSPELRTALVLVGTGTAGAYHAGVLRALREAGVKIDLVAGRGMGAVAAMFSAVDGEGALWDTGGVWAADAPAQLYPWRLTLRWVLWTVAAALAVLFVPLAVLIGAAVVYPVGFFLRLLGSDGGNTLAVWYGGIVDLVFAPDVLPLLLPRFAFFALVVLLGILVVGEVVPRVRRGRRRRARGLVWWRMVGAPLDVSHAIERMTAGLWKIMRGATRIARPSPSDLAERYGELLADNVGQPGFRELLVVVHDLDTRRDLVFGLLGRRWAQSFFARRLGQEGAERHLELLDLDGPARPHGVDALSAALCLPVLTEAHEMRFAMAGPWRGETHALVDRPEAVARLLEEVARAGADQVIVVSALPESRGPHAIESGRRDARGRAGEHLTAGETAALRDALAAGAGRFQAVFQIRPTHNPLGPFDFGGAYDERSDRTCTLAELVERGREDGFLQFVDPVVGASGEWMQQDREPSSPGSPVATSEAGG